MYLEDVTHLPLVPILKPFRSRLGKLFEIVVRYKETQPFCRNSPGGYCQYF